MMIREAITQRVICSIIFNFQNAINANAALLDYVYKLRSFENSIFLNLSIFILFQV